MMNPRNKKTGCLIVVSGPSGTGKSTIVNTVLDTCNDLSFSVSATTRQQREGETEGVDYFFVTKERFQQMIDNNELLEHAEYVGNYYGTPRKAVLDKIENGSSILLDIEVQGAEQVKDQFPEAVTMFGIPPSWEELERRLVNRGTDSMEKIQARLKQTKSEIEKIENYDYIIVNDVLETAISEVISIIATQNYKYNKRINDLTEAYSL